MITKKIITALFMSVVSINTAFAEDTLNNPSSVTIKSAVETEINNTVQGQVKKISDTVSDTKENVENITNKIKQFPSDDNNNEVNSQKESVGENATQKVKLDNNNPDCKGENCNHNHQQCKGEDCKNANCTNPNCKHHQQCEGKDCKNANCTNPNCKHHQQCEGKDCKQVNCTDPNCKHHQQCEGKDCKQANCVGKECEQNKIIDEATGTVTAEQQMGLLDKIMSFFKN